MLIITSRPMADAQVRPADSKASDFLPAMPGEWPLRSFLELGALPDAVPCGRLHTRQVAWEWGLAQLANDLELLVSELLTNAVAAARVVEPVLPVRLWLLSDPTRVAVQVWDASHEPPVRTPIDEGDESGRGLLLVEAISHRWGWYPARDTIGKVVWATVLRAGVSKTSPGPE